jgi:beta-N-acetylhexosaminidase
LKHFPGHGDIQDTHVGRSVLSYGKSRLYATELLPFFKARAGAIMLGHIEAPALDDSGLPATLSAKMVSILRDEAGFDGVLITDAMDMGAIADRYSLSVASVMAVRAGVDLILLGSHTPIDKQIAAYRAVLDAARGDKTLEARIDAAVQRIIRFKNNHGLGAWSAFTMSNPVPDIHLDASAEVLGNTYAAALTLVRNTDGLLPVGANQKVLINYPKEYPAIRRACTSVQIAQTEYNAVSFLPLNYELGVAAALAKKADVIIVFTENARVNTAQRRLVAALSPTRTVVIALGSPYDNQVLPDVAGYALTYGAVEPAFVAACAGIFGQEGWRGVLPVRLGEQYPAGWKAR